MILLCISTSAKRPSAAVMKRHLGREAVVSYCVESRPGVSHSESLMALIEEALDAAQVDKTELEAIAVDVGPGSFTGVRIGVSCANAMALALGIPVIVVPWAASADDHQSHNARAFAAQTGAPVLNENDAPRDFAAALAALPKRRPAESDLNAASANLYKVLCSLNA